MLLITKAHAYEREPYYQMFDSMGADITWMHVDHPAAEAFMTPKYANRYDVAFFYDMNGAQADLGRSKREPAPNNPFYPNGTRIVVNPPSAELQRGYPELLQHGQGHGLHPPLAGLLASQLARVRRSDGRRVRLGQFDYDARRAASAVGLLPDDAAAHHRRRQERTRLRRVSATRSTSSTSRIRARTTKTRCTPLLRTDFKPADHNRNLSPNWKYSNLAAWVKTAENSPVAYIQMGHGPAAWSNESYRKLVLNAIKWAASPEALAWAKANPKRIFKSSTN